MNIDDLFKLFSDEDRELSKDKLPVLDFTEHPVYWVGMFTKIIKNIEHICTIIFSSS